MKNENDSVDVDPSVEGVKPTVTPSASYQAPQGASVQGSQTGGDMGGRNRKLLLWGCVAAALVIVATVAVIWLLHSSHSKQQQKPAASATTGQHLLRVGTVIDENGVNADRQEFTPFINYLAKQLQGQGITGGTFVPVNTVADMAQQLREGKVDLYIDSVFPSFVADKLAGSSIIADRWKERVETYRTIIFVKQNSSIKTSADLKGKIVAFDGSNSTTGYFLPKAQLIQDGYSLSEVSSPRATVPTGTIGYNFVHDKVFDSVANGTLPAGGESEQEIRDHFGSTFDQNYRVVLTTPYVYRFLVSSRSDLSPSLVSAIKSTLYGMDQVTGGKDVLKSFSDTAKFTPVTNDSAYGVVQSLSSLVEDEIVRGASATSQ